MADDRESEFEREQEQEAAAEAAGIGGRVSSNPTEFETELDEADRAVEEGGGGESEGFELAEALLEEHASHGDEHSAGRIIEDAALLDEGETEQTGEVDGGADVERDPDY